MVTQHSINYKTSLRQPVTDKQGCALLMISIQMPALVANTHHIFYGRNDFYLFVVSGEDRARAAVIRPNFIIYTLNGPVINSA